MVTWRTPPIASRLQRPRLVRKRYRYSMCDSIKGIRHRKLELKAASSMASPDRSVRLIFCIAEKATLIEHEFQKLVILCPAFSGCFCQGFPSEDDGTNTPEPPARTSEPYLIVNLCFRANTLCVGMKK